MDRNPESILVSTTGNSLSPEKWVERYADFLYAYALGRLGNEDMARELVQETFLAALEKVGSFRMESSEKTWLTAIIKYKIIDVFRKRADASNLTGEMRPLHRHTDEFFDEQSGHWKDEHAPRPFGVEQGDPLHNKEFMRTLQKCISKLPSLWNDVFTMKHIDEMKTDEICRELQISTNNFWVIVHRAKVNLRSCLQKNWI